MSQRHHQALMPVTEPELTAHARSERQRVRVQLAMLTGGVEDIDEPGVAYRAPRRHDPDGGSPSRDRHRVQHWKQPFWKRRSASRRARVEAELVLRSA